MAKELKYVMLLDCYGDLLTDHQRNIMELYYCEDLSLGEIGSDMGITRQAVRSHIKRTEELLIGYEDKLGFVQRLVDMRKCFGRISELAGNINDTAVRESILAETDRGLNLL